MNRSSSRIRHGMIIAAFVAACDVEPTPEAAAVCNQPASFDVDPLGDPSMCSSYEPETAGEPIAVTFVNDSDEDVILRGWGCDGYFQLINARFGRITLAPVTCLTEQPPCEWMLRGEGSCVATCPRAPDIRIAPRAPLRDHVGAAGARRGRASAGLRGEPRLLWRVQGGEATGPRRRAAHGHVCVGEPVRGGLRLRSRGRGLVRGAGSRRARSVGDAHGQRALRRGLRRGGILAALTPSRSAVRGRGRGAVRAPTPPVASIPRAAENR
jgi:hypothetical protein